MLSEIGNGSWKWRKFQSFIEGLNENDKDKYLSVLWNRENFPILLKLLESFDTFKKDFAEPNLHASKIENASSYLDVGVIESANRIIKERKEHYQKKELRPAFGYMVNAPGTGKSRSSYEIARSVMKNGICAINVTFNDRMTLNPSEKKEYSLQIRILASYFFDKETFKKDSMNNYKRWTSFVSKSITWGSVLEFVVWHWKEIVHKGKDLPKDALSHDGKPLVALIIDELSLMTKMEEIELSERLKELLKQGFFTDVNEADAFIQEKRRNFISFQYVILMKNHQHPSYLLCPFFSTLEPEAIIYSGGSPGGADPLTMRLFNYKEIEEIANSAGIDFNNRFIKNLLLSTRGNPRVIEAIVPPILKRKRDNQEIKNAEDCADIIKEISENKSVKKIMPPSWEFLVPPISQQPVLLKSYLTYFRNGSYFPKGPPLDLEELEKGTKDGIATSRIAETSKTILYYYALNPNGYRPSPQKEDNHFASLLEIMMKSEHKFTGSKLETFLAAFWAMRMSVLSLKDKAKGIKKLLIYSFTLSDLFSFDEPEFVQVFSGSPALNSISVTLESKLWEVEKINCPPSLKQEFKNLKEENDLLQLKEIDFSEDLPENTVCIPQYSNHPAWDFLVTYRTEEGKLLYLLFDTTFRDENFTTQGESNPPKQTLLEKIKHKADLVEKVSKLYNQVLPDDSQMTNKNTFLFIASGTELPKRALSKSINLSSLAGVYNISDFQSFFGKSFYPLLELVPKNDKTN